MTGPAPPLEFSLQLLWETSGIQLKSNPDHPIHFNSALLLPFLDQRRKSPMDANTYVRDMGFVAAIEVVLPDELHRKITLSGDGAWPNLPQLGFTLRRDTVEQFEQCTISALPPPSELGRQAPQYLVADIGPWAFAADRVNALEPLQSEAIKAPEVRRLALAAGAVLLNAAAL